MIKLDALKDLKLGEVLPSPVRVTGQVKPVEGDIKIYRNGRIYFSDEFKAKVDKSGLDFIDSRPWTLYPDNAEDNYIFMCITPMGNPKTSAKVTVPRESNKTPMSGVSSVLIPLLIDLYGLDKDFGSVELDVEFGFPVTNDSGIYNIPKVISRGDAKGELKTVRRENVTFYPITIVTEKTKAIVNEEAMVEIPDILPANEAAIGSPSAGDSTEGLGFTTSGDEVVSE